MAINKIIYGNRTLIDLTQDTVTPEGMLEGYSAHSADGNKVYGTIGAITNQEIDEIMED